MLWNPQILAFGHRVNQKQRHGKVWQGLHKNVVCAHQSFMKIFQISYLLLHHVLIQRLACIPCSSFHHASELVEETFVVHVTGRSCIATLSNVHELLILQHHVVHVKGRSCSTFGIFVIFCAVVDHQAMLLPQLPIRFTWVPVSVHNDELNLRHQRDVETESVAA